MSEEAAVTQAVDDKPALTMDQLKAAMPPVLVTLMEVHKGELVTTLSEEMRDLIATIRELGKGGELTMKMKIAPHDTGAVRAVDINWDITVKKPKAKQRPSCAFVRDDNHLSRRDPAQREFVGGGFEE